MGKGGPAVTDGQFYCLIVGGLACAALALWSAAGYVGARLRFPAHTYRLHREAERIIRREDRQRGQHR